MRSEGVKGSGHSRFQERIRDVFLVASYLSICTIQEVSVVLLGHPGRSRRHRALIDGTTALLGEIVLRHVWSDRRTAIWISPAGCLQEGGLCWFQGSWHPENQGWNRYPYEGYSCNSVDPIQFAKGQPSIQGSSRHGQR